MARIRDFVVSAAPVGPDVSGSIVFERFQNEPDTLAIAVVDEGLRPLGLVERNAFTLKMAAEFGRALYARRPISALMDASPLILEGGTEAEALFRTVDAAGLGGLLSGFIVTEQGCYAGVGSGVQVLQAAGALARRRADEMAALASNLSRAEAEARASSRAKSEFLAVMSHEIRTPLNGVLGVAALMERQLEQESLRPHLRTILDSGASLLRLLTDALDMSRAEAGMLSLEPAPMNLTNLAEDLQALWRARAEEKGLTLLVACEAGDAAWVQADETRLKQLLNNLIGNAIKFTPEGRVEARVSAHREDGRVTLTACIDDTGPGVPPERAQTVFQPFNTGDATRQGAGAGLGLAICRQIVERMGGRIAAEASPLGGARFRFELVLEPANPETGVARMAVAAPIPHDTLHVLVADDHPANRFLAGKLLEMFGCSHDAVENGAEAVEAVRTRAYDLILMDIKMPIMDGVAATRAIRGLDGAQAVLPILALTANADERDAAAYLAAGMDGVVQKPVQPDVLLNAIRRAVGARMQAAA
ncbi:MAG: ATP-binding protein [Brevundimonas sp.]|uniref:ATP-binding protein n=1 Tax=Brevundimonas sp. TaxID=1871086 RepID=UPI00391A104A